MICSKFWPEKTTEKGAITLEQEVREESYQLTMVCVDRYEQNVMQGRLYNSSHKGEICFFSLMEFLRKMESMLDKMQYPQSYVAMRAFGEEGAPLECVAAQGEKREGVCATFAVRVLFRQNASWQGRVAWLEGGKEENFRSALELIFLMDSALKREKE